MKTRDETRPAQGTSLQSLDEQLRFAIAQKRLLQLSYQGRPRIAEPHDYGVQNGVPRLLIYQRYKMGGSGKDARVWRLLDTAKISNCVVLEESFSGTRAESTQRHHVWDVLYARVT
jgi:hypothetical protein